MSQELKRVIGIIVLVIIGIPLVMFGLGFISDTFSQIGCKKYIDENQQLKEKLQECESNISSLNKSLDEKNKLIANLTANLTKTREELNKTKEENENLTKYCKWNITEINYFFNISNQLTEIKNTFLVIEISIIVLFSLVLFEIRTTLIELKNKIIFKFRTLAGKLKNKNNKNQSKTQEKTPTENKLSQQKDVRKSNLSQKVIKDKKESNNS